MNLVTRDLSSWFIQRVLYTVFCIMAFGCCLVGMGLNDELQSFRFVAMHDNSYFVRAIFTLTYVPR